MWKVCSVVVICWLKRSVVLHNDLHGFRERRGTGTAMLEAKLAQKLAGITHEPLFQVLLDVRKAYDSLDRYQRLELLRGYGMGPKLARILDNYWKRQWIVPKVGK